MPGAARRTISQILRSQAGRGGRIAGKFGRSSGSIIDVGGVSAWGDTFFVQSTHAHAGDQGGGSVEVPFKTLDYAIGRCTADQGDIIVVGPGHTEVITAAGGITCDVAGIRIIGDGVGTATPKIIFTTVTTATFLINANNIWIEGLWFECDKTGADLVTMIDINTASHVTIKNCLFTEGASDEQALRSIILQATSDDYCTIRDCRFISETAGAAAAVDIQAAVNEFAMAGCDLQGDFSVACLMSTSAHLNCRVIDNIMRNDGAADHAIEFTSNSCTGIIAGNWVQTKVTAGGASDSIDIGGCGAIENYAADGDANTSGVLTPPATS